MHIRAFLFLALPSPTMSLLQATYRGRFEHLVSNCEGPPPVLRVSCNEGSNLDIINTSDATIVCTKDSVGNNTNNHSATCNNTCSSRDDCSSIWLQTRGSPIEGVFGNITFTCTGDHVNATFIYEDSGNGTCESGLTHMNFHVAQLGILCGDDTDFSFDANIFECTSGGALNAGDRPSLYTEQKEGRYTCASGGGCRRCNVEYDPVTLVTDEHRVPADCIVSLDGAPKPVLSAPAPKPSPPGDYKTTFQALWATAFSSSGQCRSALIADELNWKPVITVKCLNGKIKLLDTLHATVQCSTDDEATLICTEPTGREFMSYLSARTFSGMTYECAGPALPETSVEMASLELTCDPRKTTTGTVVPRVMLGVACNDTFEEDPYRPYIQGFRYYDPYFECADGSDFDVQLPGEGEAREFDFYECNRIVPVPPDYSSGDILVTGSVGASTDYRWSHLADPSCYSFVAAPTAPTTPVPTATRPTAAPSLRARP